MTKKTEETREQAFVNISLNEKGQLVVDSNISPLGAIHLSATAIRFITEKGLGEEDQEEEVH